MAPPRPPSPCLPRDDLVRRARAGLEGGLLRVVAAAGYGKTTLLAQAVRGMAGPVVWCACDARVARAGLSRTLGEAAAGAADGELTVVLDDVDALLGTPAEQELAELVRELPMRARLALAGRRAGSGPLAAPRPEAVDLDERALAVSADECARLLAALGVDASPEEAAEAQRRAEGWIAGIVLAARSSGDPGDYLLAEAVDPLDEPARRLLEDCAILDRFTPEIAARVTGRQDADALIEELLERRAFLERDDAGWLREHRLMRDALQRRVAAQRPESLMGLHGRAAAALAAVGQPEAAARHHLAGGDLTAAITALAPERTAERGGGTGVGQWLEAVPPDVWSDTPGVVLAQASQLFYRADYAGAFAAMEAAVERLVADGDHQRAAVTLVRLLRAAPLAGALYDRTIAAARRLIPQIGESAEMLPSARVMLALLLAETCRYVEAEEELSMASAATGQALTRLHVAVTRAFAIDHPQGRRAQALAALDGAIEELEEHAELDLLNYILYARAFRAIVLTDIGRFADALAESELLRAAAAERGFERLAVPVVAMLRLGALAGLGALDQLGVELARSAPAFRRLGGALRGYRHDVAAATLAAATGDVDGVRRALAAAREGLSLHGLPHDSAMALVDLALAALRVDLVDDARELAGEARARAARAEAPWAGVRAAMAAAAAWGPGAEGDAALAEAVRRSSDRRLTALWSRRERALAVRLLPRALADGIGPPGAAVRLAAACGGEVLAACADADAGVQTDARRALAEASAAAVAADVAIDRLVRDEDPDVRRAALGARGARRRGVQAGIRLVTLGGLAVHLGGQRLADSAFGRQKARILLAVLACSRGPVHREALVETLWPTLSARRGLAALHSTLYALRRALEPQLTTGQRSSLVRAEGVTYRLALGERDSWDADEFLRAARAGLSGDGERLSRLLDAERAYGGTLLPEWPFAPWTEPLRTELEETYRAVLVRIAQELAAAGRAPEAISRYRLLIAGEPEREGWHRELMGVYVDAGERALALRQYDTCRRLLRDRLGIEPSAETRQLHAQILRDS
jgi:DNA-binding SARP family transcriptional activator/ATP/maltotriose-dependent transcriptional regulator MalT